MIKYLGSKRALLPLLVPLIGELDGARSVLDLFSGTSRVGHALKERGLRVVSNDHNAYAATLARGLVVANSDRAAEAQALLDELSEVPAAPGYFTRTFCEEARFFHPDNGAKVDAIREDIANRELDPELEAIALTALMLAADKVDSTTGVQMAYLKQYARRAFKPLSLRLPPLLPRAAAGAAEAWQLDAIEAARSLKADVAYLDPPYNQHKYLGNYHVWETLVRWDAPEAYGIARKRVDCRSRRSAFNSRPGIRPAMAELIDALDVRWLVVSFSDEGYLPREELEEMLQVRGKVTVYSQEHPRYVGARIGIYGPSGEKVGRVSHLRNTEHVFVVDCASVSTPTAGGGGG